MDWFRIGFEKQSMDLQTMRKVYDKTIKPKMVKATTIKEEIIPGIPHLTRDRFVAKARSIGSPRSRMNVETGETQIVSGGHGGYVKQFSSYDPRIKESLKDYTPEEKEVTNRIAHFHEKFETDVNRKQENPYHNWHGHASPEVLLRENNVIASLPSDLKRGGKPFTVLRRNIGESEVLEQAVPGFQYGETRLSRHGLKHMKRILEDKGIS